MNYPSDFATADRTAWFPGATSCGAFLASVTSVNRPEVQRGFSSRIWFGRMAQVLCCLALWLVISSGAARATLITIDDPSFGPNSLVLDTNTGLEWLNLRFSQGLSARQVLAQTGPGGKFAGFQYANREQFVTLFTEVFGSSFLLGQHDLNATINFATLFGPTGFQTVFQTIGTQQLPTLSGLFDVSSGPGGVRGSATGITFFYDTDIRGNLVGATDTSSFGLDNGSFEMGSFLVAVPEPSLSLISVSLLGLAAVMLRRRLRLNHVIHQQKAVGQRI
jgi:hypothetical protein